MSHNKNNTNKPISLRDIDYDKLAEALVRAQELAHAQHTKSAEHPPSKNHRFWRTLWNIFVGKADSDSVFVNNLMAIPLATIFSWGGMLGIIGVIFTLIYVISSYINTHQWFISAPDTVFQILWCALYIAVALPVLMMSFAIRAAGLELEKMDDRDYIASVFSGMVGFAALIISIIAFIR